MRAVKMKSALIKSALAAAVLLLGTGASYAQQAVNLTAAPGTTILPDGTSVPMWGYTCGTVVAGSTATCTALNPAVQAYNLANPTLAGTKWSPIVITVPTGQALQVNLTNNLSFTAGTTTNKVPTSMVILGQLGGGLGTGSTTSLSPTHPTYPNTWFTAGDTSGATFAPPGQNARVQSFATEVVNGTPGTLNWTAPNAGTYLLQSGTHPSIQVPMGLYGMVVVTAAPTASGTAPATTETAAGCAYPGATTCAVPYDAEVDLLMSEIDPVQNNAVNKAVTTAGFVESSVLNLTLVPPTTAQAAAGAGSTLGGVACSGGAAACYPPAVNYTPSYFLFNGQAFDKTTPTNSLFATAPSTLLSTTGTVLVRAVNAGLRMHVPALVNTQTTGNPAAPLAAAVPGMTLVAEDGNLLPPAAARVQTEMFMAAGKTNDFVYTTTAASQLTSVYDRELSLSANAINRDAGMLAYIGVGGATLPTGNGAFAGTGAAAAVADTYLSIIAGQTLTVSDPSKGVLANDKNVLGAQLVVSGAAVTGPVAGTNGTLTLNADGTFTYVASATAPAAGTVDTFTYCGNGTLTGAACTTLTLGAAAMEAGTGITVNPDAYSSTVSSAISIKAPGVLQNDSDSFKLPLTVAGATATAPRKIAACGGMVTLAADGSFTASGMSAGTCTFSYQAQNSQGVVSSASATVTLTFPTASNLAVTVLDPISKATITDYRWIIEEDETFYVDPKCTTNPLPATCPTVTPQGAPFAFGTNFHTSHMPVVAAGCTGTLSCETGQTLQGTPAVCDIGNGICRTDAASQPILLPSAVNLDPTKRYYLTVFPGDAANPFVGGNLSAPAVADCKAVAMNPFNADGSLNTSCGHGMGGVAIPAPCLPKTVQPAGTTCTTPFAPVTILTQPSPFPTGKLTVHVFEDDFPLDGIFSPGGGIDVIAPNEPGLGGFEITLLDSGGGPGDATGQITYDMFNQPLSNSLVGTLDPVTGNDACPVSAVNSASSQAGTPSATPGPQTGVVGMVVTCPTYESDGVTLSPLAGMAIIGNLYPGRFGVVANPGADRIAAGEEWLQTNTLDGQKGHDAFIRIGEPAYFQEYGPSGFHVDIGFANPKIINSRMHNTQNVTGTGLCDPAAGGGGGLTCNNTVTGHITNSRLSRVPDQRIYGSRTRDSFGFTQCFVSLGDPDGFDFAFTKCDANGNFTFTGLPAGNWKITTFDQWNDAIIDGITTPVALNCGAGVVASGLCAANASNGITLDMGELAVNQWQANIYTRTFLDLNGNGVSDKDANGNDLEPGLVLESTNNRWRDGSFSNFNNTDLNGYANYNEVFPLFNWYVVEGYTTRYKTTGVHVVMDAGGPPDVDTAGTLCNAGITSGNAANGNRACAVSNIAANMANTYDLYPLPPDVQFPGAIYCNLSSTADCKGKSMNPGLSAKVSGGTWTNASDKATCTANTVTAGGSTITLGENCSPMSTGRIDPPTWFGTYGWQGFIGQNQYLEFGKKPYVPGETGGIRGHVVYASTRPFDDPQLLLQTQWTPQIPHVTINLYKEGFAADGVTPTLTLVDTTQTSSFDDWVQGFRADGKPNISCPGQTPNDPLFYGLANQPTYLDWYNNVLHGTATAAVALPYQSQYKCYDGMHNWNQLQPVPYDGLYQFPSVTGISATTGKPTGTNCTACVTDVDADDTFRYGGSTTAQPFVSGTSAGWPVLPAGKYVVEVVVPPGYELVKEEDKNILIGDNFVAPATVQFPGLGGNIFILPDLASLAAEANTTNPQNPTNNLGRVANLPSHEGDTGSVEAYWPCVGAARQVPDYLSIFPQAQEVAPFAGAVRNLCDRKEVLLTDQSSALAKFYLFSSTHIAAHFTGVILDDFTGEFDPFSPQFGEKFAPAYLPVSVKDWAGNETNRVYADEFGLYNGLNYSTWEVDPPNPTGYGPTMMVMCMNDSGHTTPSPWWDTAAAGTTSANPDPFFQPNYSTFCYELAFMPGQTGYFDTPVVPTSAFSEGYNHPDCNYPDTTPAIKEVDGDGVGPWVSAAGKKLTITALGDQLVDNYAYSGPNATTTPFNQQKITRHYGFGTTAGTVVLVDPAGVSHALTGVSWSDGVISGTVPSWTCNTSTTAPNCPTAQQAAFAGSGASRIQSGQLIITAANGKTTVDTVTVWIGGKAPAHVASSGLIQDAIDAAAPGDLIIVDPTCNAVTTTTGANTPLASCTSPLPTGTTLNKVTVAHNEMLQMWKPVRLQGVGAASSLIDANTQPAGKLLDPWRTRLNCLVGLDLNGRPRALNDVSCANTNGTAWKYASGGTEYTSMIADRLPFEAMLGWDASLNGNVAEQLIEPSLMGAYEGAAITVLAKGVKIPTGTPVLEAFGAGVTNVGAAFPDNTTLLLASDCKKGTADNTSYPTNFWCNPSSIDGLGIRNSSQGGGGVFVHAYAHNLQIANNRVYNNTGTMGGGIIVGLGEHADPQLAGAAQVATMFPGSCDTTTVSPAGMNLPFCYDMNVNVHHNSLTLNASMGDELFSSTPAGAGGANFMSGSDNYRFTNNWVCGNMAAGDGGGVAQIGMSMNGLIANNTIIFNQSTNPSITTNGGGLLLMGAPDADPTTCGTTTDIDCVPPPGTISPSDGVGRNIKVNANLILGNGADSGSGGGLRLQHINGTDVVNVPNGATVCTSAANCSWNSVSVTNNIIANNVAGWDGAGVSLQDTLVANIVNNTIVSNDSTASSGALLTSLFSQSASAVPDPAHNCVSDATNAAATGSTNGASCAQISGLVSTTNSPVLMANLRSLVDAGSLTCAVGHGGSATAAKVGGGTLNVPACFYYSIPLLVNDAIWENHSYYIGVGGPGAGTANDQNQVKLFNAFANTLAASQPQAPATTANGAGAIITGGTGACVSTGVTQGNYWEIGVRGDTSPTGHGAYTDSDTVFTLATLPLTLAPQYSLLTDAADYGPAATTHNIATDPHFVQLYCNGSRTPPENGGPGWLVPPGTIEANGGGGNNGGLIGPAFTLTPSAVVDEGNNWINLRWGPLSLTHPVSGVTLGNYALTAGSAAINAGTSAVVSGVTPPTTDFFGVTRSAPNDIGAVEFAGGSVTVRSASVSPSPLAFGSWATRTQSNSLPLTVTNTGTVALAGGTFTFGGGSALFSRPAGAAGGTCGAALAVGASCTINVRFAPGTTLGAVTRTLTVAYTGATVTPTPVQLTGTGVATRGTLTITPVTITLPAGTLTGTGTVTVTNNAASLSSVAITADPVTGAGASLAGVWAWTANGADTCVGSNLVPGASCTVSVRFTRLGAVGTHAGAITFTDTATGSPQADVLTGIAQ